MWTVAAKGWADFGPSVEFRVQKRDRIIGTFHAALSQAFPRVRPANLNDRKQTLEFGLSQGTAKAPTPLLTSPTVPIDATPWMYNNPSNYPSVTLGTEEKDVEKLVYLIFEQAERSGNDLHAMLQKTVVPTLQQIGARGIRLNVHDEEVYAGQPQITSGFRKGPPIRAMLCFWLDSADQRAPFEEALALHTQGFAGYLVLESCPLVHAVRAGERTSGFNQVTCINRRPDLDHETFLELWQQDHRKVAIELQSTVGYVRNLIVRALTNGAPPFDAIVEETFPIEALTDQRVFYDHAESEEALAAGVARMMESCERFLDFEPMEMNFMSEYVVEEG